MEEAVNVISSVHQIAGLPPIAQSPFVMATLAGLQRTLAKPKFKKEPVSREILAALVDSLTLVPSLGDVRMVASSLLAYAAFLRFDELAKLRRCDANFTAENMAICITSSKTNQLRQDDTVLVARTGSATCLVAMLEHYIVMAETDRGS